MIRAFSIIALTTALASGGPAAQATPRGTREPVRLMVFMEAALAAVPETDVLALYESLIVALTTAETPIEVVETPEIGAVPASAAERSRIAGRKSARGWLWVGLSGDADGLRADVTGYDVMIGRSPVEMRLEMGRVATIGQDLWREAVETIGAFYRGQPEADGGRAVTRGPVTVAAAPGTRLTGLGGDTVVVGAEGHAGVELRGYSSYTVTASHPGYIPATLSFYVDSFPLSLDVEQRRIGRWAVELALERLAFPSFQVTFFLTEGLFLRTGFTRYTAGLAIWGESGAPALPLSHLRLSAGARLGSGGRRFRFSASAGAFLRLVSDDGGGYPGILLEPQAPFGFSPAGRIELNTTPPLHPFLEWGPQVFLLEDPETIQAYYETLRDTGRDVAPYFWAGPLMFDLTPVTLGFLVRL